MVQKSIKRGRELMSLLRGPNQSTEVEREWSRAWMKYGSIWGEFSFRPPRNSRSGFHHVFCTVGWLCSVFKHVLWYLKGTIRAGLFTPESPVLLRPSESTLFIREHQSIQNWGVYLVGLEITEERWQKHVPSNILLYVFLAGWGDVESFSKR